MRMGGAELSVIRTRIHRIQEQLVTAYNAGISSTDATKGREREYFIDLFLRDCLPPQFRFGSGDITDLHGRRAGQIDIVIELPFFPSFPLVGGARERLYLAEGVGVAIEIKSDLSKQWDAVIETGEKVKALHHMGGSWSGLDSSPFPKGKVPFVVVGYRGWGSQATLSEKRRESTVVDAILQIDPPFYTAPRDRHDSAGEDEMCDGPEALGAALVHLCAHLTAASSKHAEILNYFREK